MAIREIKFSQKLTKFPVREMKFPRELHKFPNYKIKFHQKYCFSQSSILNTRKNLFTCGS